MVYQSMLLLFSAVAVVLGGRFDFTANLVQMDADQVKIAGILRSAHSNNQDMFVDYYLGVILDEYAQEMLVRRSYCTHKYASWMPSREEKVKILKRDIK